MPRAASKCSHRLFYECVMRITGTGLNRTLVFIEFGQRPVTNTQKHAN